ncbi:MAG: MarR family transcriptional regulator [candidate division KSB1 bacterium]|nr:MarR family transcriptional regulator [candidate division KSB1 bacterium]MDZ7368220.1 MarR family transcriptional regulator [candidate division KSB1 bacterium]
MTAHLNAKHIKIFDYIKFVMPLREKIRANAEALAKAHGFEIEFVRKKNFDKEKRIHAILKQRGDHPGLVYILSAMESCTAYKPWYDKKTGKTYLKYVNGKCLHYYFYFIDEDLGLCYLRVPTWAPFQLQFYFNGHSLLAASLQRREIAFERLDNAFLNIADFDRANQIAWRFNPAKLHRKLDGFAQRYCPILKTLQSAYHWSMSQVEYATDIVFKRQQDSQTIYSYLLEVLIHSVKPENIASFLGKKLHGNYTGEMGNNFTVRILGTRIKHRMGPVTIKMYDKFGIVLRIEVTVNDVSFFPEFREVRHRNGSRELKWCKMRKSIYNLPLLQQLLAASTRRYLEFISAIETPEVGVQLLQRLTQPVMEKNHSYKGFNLLADEDANLLRLLLRGEFTISGFSARHLRPLLADKTPGQISRMIKRLRVHGFIKKVGKRYKYYLTQLGRLVATMALKLKELFVIPQLANAVA